MPCSTESAAAALQAACARTLAGRVEPAAAGLPEPGRWTRGQGDAAACRRRFGLPEALRAERPPGRAGVIHDALAEARAIALGALWLPGVARNLTDEELKQPPATGIGAWARAAFRGQVAGDCPQVVAVALAALAQRLAQPDEFALQARVLSLALVQGMAAEVGRDGAEPAGSGPDAVDEPAAGARPSGEATDDPACAGPAAEPDPGVPPAPLPDALMRDYRVYTSRHDRQVEAQQLAAPAELAELRARLDGALMAHRQLLTRLAHGLARRLLARQRRHWQLDQLEGRLDASRLARLVADPSRADVYRVEAEAPFPRTVVTLLLDNSGSMRGHPITVAAVTADLLTRALERCGIKVEVLGYTTAAGADNAAARDWEAAGRPPGPGRLNALRHIIYKAADTPWRRARQHFGLLLQAGLLQENIDGEALAWACGRLLRRLEPRRVLIVISDGAPMDQRTLSVNPKTCLERHLHQVIDWIEGQTAIELYALGIGHPVSRYYRRAIQLSRVDELGTVLIRGLGEWLV